jgi:glyoxylase-like metal-dependent hydrolase (beta-lactamase superfamily II)
VTETELAALGLHRIAVPIPFLAAGGPVNVFLLERADGGLTLFDAGLGTEAAHGVLLAGLARLGRRPEEIRRIVVSHGHLDHFGGAALLSERAGGAPVQVHPADLMKVDARGPSWASRRPGVRAHFARLGVPAEVSLASEQAGEQSYGGARRVVGAQPIGPGDIVEGRALRFEVLHLPGHSPGLVALHEPRLKVLLPADHLLERISPNPLLELGPDGEPGFFRPLVTYLDSLVRTRALDLDLVLPGHGPPFQGHQAVIDGLLGFYARRQARLAELAAGGADTAWSLCRALFPAARPDDTYLTLSETVGNLEVLEARGEVACDRGGPVWRYAAK